MELPANHLVGRADEVDSLERALGELDQGQPGAIELAGEPGIGKTRLLRELAARAEARRFMVLWGSASGLEHDLPFSVFLDALDEYLQGIDPGLFAPLDDGVLAELAHVFPSMEAFGRGARVALQEERYRTHRAVRTLLDHLSETKPLVLVLDDMHWGDAASVELLGALLRRPPGGPVLMALGSRPRHLPERLSTALERSRRAGTLTRIELGVLTPAEVRQLLGDSVDVADAAVLYEESGGNPLYLEQLARSLERAGPVSPPSLISTRLASRPAPTSRGQSNASIQRGARDRDRPARRAEREETSTPTR